MFPQYNAPPLRRGLMLWKRYQIKINTISKHSNTLYKAGWCYELEHRHQSVKKKTYKHVVRLMSNLENIFVKSIVPTLSSLKTCTDEIYTWTYSFRRSFSKTPQRSIDLVEPLSKSIENSRRRPFCTRPFKTYPLWPCGGKCP